MSLTDVASECPQLGTPDGTPIPRYVSPDSASTAVPADSDSCTASTGRIFGTIWLTNTRHPLAPFARADSTYDERAASNAAGRATRARFSPYPKPQAMTITTMDAPSGTARISAISTVGMEISASTTTTDELASAALRATIAAMSSSPQAAETTTVSSTMSRFVCEPASSQLNTSAPVPSVPSQCAAEGLAHTW